MSLADLLLHISRQVENPHTVIPRCGITDVFFPCQTEYLLEPTQNVDHGGETEAAITEFEKVIEDEDEAEEKRNLSECMLPFTPFLLLPSSLHP